MTPKRFYRKAMRRLARFILGFERCPTDCRKDYRESARFALGALGVTLFGLGIIVFLILTT